MKHVIPMKQSHVEVTRCLDHVILGNIILARYSGFGNVKIDPQFKDFDVIESSQKSDKSENDTQCDDFSINLKEYLPDLESLSDSFSDEGGSASDISRIKKSKDSQKSVKSIALNSRNVHVESRQPFKSFANSSKNQLIPFVKNSSFNSNEDEKELDICEDIEPNRVQNLLEEFNAIIAYHSKNSGARTMRQLKTHMYNEMKTKHLILKQVNLEVKELHFKLKQKKEFLDIYFINARVSIDGCKRERYLLMISEMEVEIEKTYKQLQEEEQLFSADVEKEGARIDTIKELLLGMFFHY